VALAMNGFLLPLDFLLLSLNSVAEQAMKQLNQQIPAHITSKIFSQIPKTYTSKTSFGMHE